MSIRICVFVKGGEVNTVVYDHEEVEITVFNYDTEGVDEDNIETDADGDECVISEKAGDYEPNTVKKFIGQGEKHVTEVTFGSKSLGDARSVVNREFCTEEARQAYLEGVSDMDGWLEYDDERDEGK
jgi:hypothetical protein